MEDQGTGSGAESQSQKPDVTLELKQKTDTLMEQNAKLSQQLEQLIAAQQRPQASSQSGSESGGDDIESLYYSDPKRYAQVIEDRSARKAEQLINTRLQQQNEASSVINQLVNDYPELSDQSSELTKKALEMYKQLPANMQSSPLAYKTAVRDAAADLGVLPKNKRQTRNDDGTFSVGGQRTSSQGTKPAEAKLDPSSLAFAELLGLNVKDKEVVKRLTERSQRKDWNKYR